MTVCGTARFTVKEGSGGRAVAAVETFVAHVRAEPGTKRYLSLRDRDDPTTFLNVMVFADEDARGAHSQSDAVRRFTEELYPMCVEPVRFDRSRARCGNLLSRPR